MIDEVSPQSNIEWLWTIDLIALSWDVLRFRSLRDKCLRSIAKRPLNRYCDELIVGELQERQFNDTPGETWNSGGGTLSQRRKSKPT
jgi:hypothetical protein